MSRDVRNAVTLVEVIVVCAISAILIGCLLSAVQAVRASAMKAGCGNNLRQLGIGLAAHHDAFSSFPAGVCGEAGAQPFLGWPAKLLPYLEQQQVWVDTLAAYEAERDFRKARHAALRGLVLKVAACPADDRAGQPSTAFGVFTVGFTSYLGNEGIDLVQRGGMLFVDSAVRAADVKDGLSHTLLVGERPPSVDEKFGWWYAGWGQDKTGSADSTLGVRELRTHPDYPDCPKGPYRFTPPQVDDPCGAFQYWSPHKGGAHFLLADGSVRFLSYSADAVLPALATRAGGEPGQDS